jgi:L-threonylcarbamoyladenylate synthase
MIKIFKPSLEAINETALALLNNGIVVVPTTRWYMIFSKAENQECIERIYSAKKRPINKPPLFVLPKKTFAKEYFKIENGAEQLIQKLWPGELTMLLQWANPSIASQYKAFNQTYAMAINPPGLFGEIANTLLAPLAATTVNISESFDKNSLGPAITLNEVMLFIQKTGIKVDVIIDGGICPTFMPTTIVDCQFEGQNPKIIREGFVHERAINVALYTNA